jgi:hypothetical protein
MGSKFVSAKDTISGREGEVWFAFDGQTPEKAAYLKSVEATAEKTKTDVNIIGSRATQHKANGWSGSGSMTLYYATTRFRKVMQEYIQNGKDVYFDIRVINADITSEVGTQDVTLIKCNVDSVVMAKLSADDEVLDEEIGFTFDDVVINSSFE